MSDEPERLDEDPKPELTPVEEMKLQFKCRRCDSTFDGPQGGRRSCEMVLIGLTVNTSYDVVGAGTLHRLDIHDCQDGGMGIGDMIGACRTFNNPTP